MIQSGIYQIINKVNGNRYVGSAVKLKRRKSQHFSKLIKNQHPNTHLQKAYNKYGFDSFEFIVLEYVANKNELLQIEQYYIDWLEPEYNICKTAGSMLGYITSDETKRKLSKAFKGRFVGEKHPMYNKQHSIETKLKISYKHKGRKHEPMTLEQKMKISIANKGKISPRKGVKLSTETKEKLSTSKTGKKQTQEHKDKVSKALKEKYSNQTHFNLGRKHSEQTCEKMSKGRQGEKNCFYGKKHSIESKNKISQKNSRSVIQLTIEGEIVAYFTSAIKAQQITGIAQGTISNVCNNKGKTAGGYKWKWNNQEGGNEHEKN